MNTLRQLEIENMKATVPDFGVGDTVDVHYLIKEGDKERVQLFSGTVIAITGRGIRRSYLVRRIVAGEGVERRFPLPERDGIKPTQASEALPVQSSVCAGICAC